MWLGGCLFLQAAIIKTYPRRMIYEDAANKCVNVSAHVNKSRFMIKLDE